MLHTHITIPALYRYGACCLRYRVFFNGNSSFFGLKITFYKSLFFFLCSSRQPFRRNSARFRPHRVRYARPRQLGNVAARPKLATPTCNTHVSAVLYVCSRDGNACTRRKSLTRMMYVQAAVGEKRLTYMHGG